MSKEIRERLVAVKELVDDYARPNSTTDGGNLYYEMHWLLTTLETTLTKLDLAVEALEELSFYSSCSACEENHKRREEALAKIKGEK